jgi:pyridoxine 5-phosphate synthase
MQEPRMARLGVNIDHVATIRQARRTVEPDPVWAAALAELGGADGITVHLREDRRHIQDRDVRLLRETVRVKLNLEMAVSDEITAFALDIRPDQCTLVPEKREEVTTEGGLDVVGQRDRVKRCVNRLQEAGIEVSLFIDPSTEQIETARELEVAAVELHTGRYADAPSETVRKTELHELIAAGNIALREGLLLHMGHGLTYRNVVPVARIAGVCELNIGHSIVSRAVLVGFERAVREMRDLVRGPLE